MKRYRLGNSDSLETILVLSITIILTALVVGLIYKGY